MRVLGIDPGTRLVGYGLIERCEGRNRAVDYGFFRIDSKRDFPGRLKEIFDEVSGLLDQWQPDVMAVEEVFVSQNAKTSLKLGHARGVILLAAMEKGVPVAEYAPREIKQAVVGRGGAAKEQVQWMLGKILNIDGQTLQPDAADGLAAALCHCLRCRR